VGGSFLKHSKFGSLFSNHDLTSGGYTNLTHDDRLHREFPSPKESIFSTNQKRLAGNHPALPQGFPTHQSSRKNTTGLVIGNMNTEHHS